MFMPARVELKAVRNLFSFGKHCLHFGFCPRELTRWESPGVISNRARRPGTRETVPIARGPGISDEGVPMRVCTENLGPAEWSLSAK